MIPLSPPSQQQETDENHGKTLELGVFMDQAAHDLFLPYFGTTHALTRFILAYINGVSNSVVGNESDVSILFHYFSTIHNHHMISITTTAASTILPTKPW